MLAVSTHCRQKRPALTPQHRHIVLGDEPDHGVVDTRILVRELVAEVDDATGVRDLSEACGDARESAATASPTMMNSRSTAERTSLSAR